MSDPDGTRDDATSGGDDASPPRGRRLRALDWRAAGTCVAAGALLALSLPPWGFWPLAIPGVVLIDRVIADRPAVSRFRRGWLVGLALLTPTMVWLKEMTFPGYLIAVAFFAAGIGGALALCPPGRGRWLALPGAWLLAEAFRGAFPFGGVPISVLAVGQVGGPLAGLARVGGTLLMGAVTVVVGVGVAAAIRREWMPALVALGVVAIIGIGAVLAPKGHSTGRSITVAYVQGGGPQGTRAEDTDPRDVFDRHMRASEAVRPGVDITLWPEDVVDTTRYVVDTPEGDELAALARRKRTTLIAGVVEDEGRTGFHNASMAWDPTGTVIDRYEKVHRVPFGEWVPFRPALKVVAGDSLPRRDAIPGFGPATLRTPHGTMAVAISWEVFFGHRARDGVRHGGEVILNPTNGSSFTRTFVQTQQIASSRLRAIENGRWVVQAAPTGFSAFVTPTGQVVDRTAVSERAVAEQRVALREGFTVYTRVGDRPFIALGVLLVALGWVLDRRGRTRTRTPEPA